MDITIIPSKIKGTLRLPPSKSQTFRAMIFAAFATGHSCIENYLKSRDTEDLIRCLKQLGAKIVDEGERLIIEGNSGKATPPSEPLYVGNSGINFRFLTALAGTIPYSVLIDGDESIRGQRNIHPLLESLQKLGVKTLCYHQKNAPLMIQGPFLHFETEVMGHDSQFVSALLIASALSQGEKKITVHSPGEIPWVELTLSWLDRLKIRYSRDSYHHFLIEGGSYSGFEYRVPSDFSTATYPIAAAMISGSYIHLEGLDFSDPQGDKHFIPLLQSLGADIQIDVKKGTLEVFGEKKLDGGMVDINPCIDCLPLLACLGAYCKNPLMIYNGEIARTKECDRIASITTELKKMGCQIEEFRDGLKVYPSSLHGADLYSYHDHRMSLSLSIASLGALGISKVYEAQCIEKTYANFVSDFKALGASISC